MHHVQAVTPSQQQALNSRKCSISQGFRLGATASAEVAQGERLADQGEKAQELHLANRCGNAL